MGGCQGDYVEYKTQSQKVAYCLVLFISHSWYNKIIEMENTLAVVRAGS